MGPRCAAHTGPIWVAHGSRKAVQLTKGTKLSYHYTCNEYVPTLTVVLADSECRIFILLQTYRLTTLVRVVFRGVCFVYRVSQV